MEDERLFEAEVECNQQAQLQTESIKPSEVVSVPFVCQHKPLQQRWISTTTMYFTNLSSLYTKP